METYYLELKSFANSKEAVSLSFSEVIQLAQAYETRQLREKISELHETLEELPELNGVENRLTDLDTTLSEISKGISNLDRTVLGLRQ